MSERQETATKQTTLKFAHRNVGFVIDGEEDATVRYDLERDMEGGDELKFLTPSGNVFAIADVEEVWTAKLRHAHFDMTATDNRSHPSTGAIDLLDRLNFHYPDEQIQLDDEVTIIYFDVWQIGGAYPE